MTDFSRISDALEAPATSNIEVKLVTLGGTQVKTIQAGMTVGDFKRMNGIEGTKMVDDSGNTLENNYVLNSNTQAFISSPKKNG